MNQRMQKLPRIDGLVQMPADVPTDTRTLLELMDEASAAAGAAEGVTAPAFDHGMRVFNQLNAHYQIHVARELARAHEGLKDATERLGKATWWLAVVTVLLGVSEVLKLLLHV